MPTATDSDSALRTLVAQFWRLRPEEVEDTLLFHASRLRNFSSVRFLTFIAAVESNFGVRIADPGAITTFAALRSATAGGTGPSEPRARVSSAIPAAPAAAAPASRPASQPASLNALAGLRLGQDIEEIASLPATTDYAAHAFYSKNFTPTEIAHCANMTNPPQHFAARLCAKEALVKTSPIFEGVTFGELEVTNDVRGQPSIAVLNPRAREALGNTAVLVSLSHTDSLASAVVLLVPGAA